MGVTGAAICRRISGSGSCVRSTVDIDADEVGGSKWLGGNRAILAKGLILSADPGFLVAPMFAAGPFAGAVGAYTPLMYNTLTSAVEDVFVLVFAAGMVGCSLVLVSKLFPGSSSPLSSLMLTGLRPRKLPLIVFFAGKEIYF